MGLSATDIAGLGMDDSLGDIEGELDRTDGGLPTADRLEVPIQKG